MDYDPKLVRERGQRLAQRSHQGGLGIARIARQHRKPDARLGGGELIDQAVGAIDDRRSGRHCGELFGRVDTDRRFLPADEGVCRVGESLDAVRLGCIALVVIGIVGLKRQAG